MPHSAGQSIGSAVRKFDLRRTPSTATSSKPARHTFYSTDTGTTGTLASKFNLSSFKPVKHTPEDLIKLKQELQTDDHRIPLSELCERLETDTTTGLTTKQALQRFNTGGPNVLSPSHTTPFLVQIGKELFSGFSILLWIGSGLCFIAFGMQLGLYNKTSEDDLYLGIVLFVVVVISAGFSYYQSAKSAKIMESFKFLMPPESTVFRDGDWGRILARELVVGDIVEIEAGETIPADIRIFYCAEFKVDDSALTGEIDPHKLVSEQSTETNPLDSENLVFMSSHAIQGTARGIVINTGDRTLLGRLANLASDVEMGETPIARETRYFVKVISCIGVGMGLCFLIFGLANNYHWLEIVIHLISLIVANVPEGLLATITISLSLAAKKMSAKNCVVKNLEAVETLGSTSVILCDKSGTLTQDKYVVAHLWYDGQGTDGETFLKNDMVNQQTSDTLKRLLRIMALCNRATLQTRRVRPGDALTEEESHVVSLHGDPAETALLKFIETGYGNAALIHQHREQSRKVCDIPYNSGLRFQVAVHETNDFPTEFQAIRDPRDGNFLLMLKGVPERVLTGCKTIYIDGKKQDFNVEWNSKVTLEFEKLSNAGERVIAFCEYHLPDDEYPSTYEFEADIVNLPLDNLSFLGLVSLFDPPRPSVPEAVAKCRLAGVRVIMIATDHPITAQAVARQVGIFAPDHFTIEEIMKATGRNASEINPEDAKACIIHGNKLKRMAPQELDDMISRHMDIIFARTSPQQKLLIVESLQRLNYVVAVTGNSINDSPALKRANIGIAMGISGSEISKEAADMILMDDNFTTIVSGIEEGRLIFDNLKKLIAYTLSSNMTELIPFILYIIINIPLPLGTITIFCIDLGTDLLPAISLIREDSEIYTMRRPPRNPRTDRLVTAKIYHVVFAQLGIIEACAGIFTYFVVMADYGFLPGDLLNLRSSWDNHMKFDLKDSYNQEWNYAQRMELQHLCHTAYFVCVVMVQWAGIIIFKTRVNSIFQQGMRNKLLNFSICFETVLMIILIYVPVLNSGLKLYPVRINYWVSPIFWGCLLFFYDEFRRYEIRRHPDGFFERELFY